MANLRSSRRANLNQTQERTEFLINTLGSGAVLAGLLGVNRSQPTQWRKGAESPSPEVGRGLLDLDYVVARASMLWQTDSVVAWLQGQNAFLEGARPIDVLRTRGSHDVVDALDAELAGAYA
ncbi:antitoxin Xre/MbcA/ParS toxin-binding domain-containing protein [Diaminobutyricibacter sp. McL0608]|uniref:antitoxin Xre/MbcA/ParS toxin-binding domain-containing protein n=1 Tax=Leifsonia sp. McL0608 TaxID=3143537 RepID=UPI0031F2E501